MTAFLKIDRCRRCRAEKSWEWVPPVLLGGKALAGTAVWRSTLIAGICTSCQEAEERERIEALREQLLKAKLVRLFGGERPYREFTFERFRVAPGNHAAFERARTFEPQLESLYLWGPCGVGKTHLAFAIACAAVEHNQTVEVFQPPRMLRLIRMKPPDEEQAVLDRVIRADVLVLDDLGMGHETPYTRQVLQEILDGRHLADRNGLVVTSKYSLADLASKMDDDTIPSRLAGTCRVVSIADHDHRTFRLAERPQPTVMSPGL